jgi:hypothetical protein
VLDLSYRYVWSLLPYNFGDPFMTFDISS